MAGSVERVPGGIWGLLDGLELHGEAIEHDLVAHGWTLDDIPHRLNWRAFRSFIRHSSHRPGSALSQTMFPDVDWDLEAHLLAGIYDLLAVANWQRGGGGAGRRPKPLPRPGDKPGTTVVADVVPISHARSLLRRLNPGAWSDPESQRRSPS